MAKNSQIPEIEKPKHPGGRPTKYTDSMPDRLRDYVDGGYKGNDEVIPTQAGFASKLKIAEQTLWNWGEKYPEFMEMLDYLRAKQHYLLMNKGLISEFNSTIAKLLLVSDHRHTERTDITSGGEKITPQLVSFENALEIISKQPSPEEPQTGNDNPS